MLLSHRAAALATFLSLTAALPSLAIAQREVPPPPPDLGDPELIATIEALSDLQVEVFLETTYEEAVSNREVGGWVALITGVALGGVGAFGLLNDPGRDSLLYGTMLGTGVGVGVTSFVLSRTPSPYEAYMGKLTSDQRRRAREGRSAIELIIETERYERTQAGTLLLLGGGLVGALSVPLLLEQNTRPEFSIVTGTVVGVSALYLGLGAFMLLTKGDLEQRLDYAAEGGDIALLPGLLVGPDGQVGMNVGFSW